MSSSSSFEPFSKQISPQRSGNSAAQVLSNSSGNPSASANSTAPGLAHTLENNIEAVSRATFAAEESIREKECLKAIAIEEYRRASEDLQKAEKCLSLAKARVNHMEQRQTALQYVLQQQRSTVCELDGNLVNVNQKRKIAK